MKSFVATVLCALALCISGCNSTVENNKVIVEIGDQADIPADKCRLTLQAIPYSSTNIMESAAHEYHYRRVKLLNASTNECTILGLSPGKNTVDATIDLSTGLYILQSVILEDASVTRNSRQDIIPAIREVRLRQPIRISADSVGHCAIFRFDPHAINDFTSFRVEAR
jgi:hypothetical protein